MNPDKITSEALARIKRSEPSFITWLESRYAEYCKSIATMDGTQLHWVQGRMQELQQIIDTMTKVEKIN
jgi:hypothetical protein